MKRFIYCLVLTFAMNGTGAKALPIPWIDVADTINPGSADYIISQINRATEEKAPYLVLRLDTPGGLLTATRSIVQAMLNSPVPVVVYVSPKGAHAGSAGALITFAADVAVMAPGTNIGAAHPVVPGEEPSKTMNEKMANDTAAFAEGLARAKGRNAEWAALSVRESASLTADKALEKNVIDLIAEDPSDLALKLKGYRMRVKKGSVKALPNEKPTFENREMTHKQRFISFFSDPNVAYLLLSFAGLCIWVEITHPGLIVPGVLGGISAILAGIAFQFLPIEWGALAFVILGLILLILEAFVPSFGALGLGGIASFVIGSIFLMDTDAGAVQISLWLILPTAIVLGGTAFVLAYAVFRSRGRRLQSGVQTLLGERAEVRESIAPGKMGKVFVQGELWNARLAETHLGGEIGVGAEVVVKGVRGMELSVEPVLGKE